LLGAAGQGRKNGPGQLRRRILGLLRARLPDLGLEQVQDPRQDKGLRWQLPALLSVVLTAMVAGCKPLREAEQLTAQIPQKVARRLLRIARRVPDTTLRTVLRVQSQTWDHGVLVKSEDRYFVCSLPVDRFTNAQWLQLLRRYWMVENGPHFTLDVALQEDDHPWIEADPQGALVLALLRRVAYNLLALYRCVTLRSESSRQMPWKQLIEDLRFALLTACDCDLIARRDHIPAHAAASLSQPALV
jgi:hypothetical protein